GSARFCGLESQVPQSSFVPAQAGAQSPRGSDSDCGPWVPACAGTNGDNRKSDESHICFTHNGRHAVIAIAQRLRPDAAETVARLAALGCDLRILSGDRPSAVAPVAAALGIAQWQGALKPA